MRAVHFHPHGLPIVLTAEVQDPSPTPELPATLTEQGPYVQQWGAGPQVAEEGPATPAAASAAARGSAAAAAAPPSGEVPIPSPQLLQGAAGSSSSIAQQQQQQQQDVAQPAAGVYVATADGPVPMQQLSSAAVGGAAPQGPQPLALDLPAAALALSSPLYHLQLRSSASSPGLAAAASAAAAGEGPAASGRHPQGAPSSSRAGAPGWVPPNSAQLPPSMVPTGWELPFPSSLFSGAQQAAAGTAAGGGPGSQGHGLADADSGWAATVASLPQVMAAFSAAAWNIIGEEQPPRVRLRMWRFDAAKPTALLAVLGAEQASSNLLLQIPDAVLCSGGQAGKAGWGRGHAALEH